MSAHSHLFVFLSLLLLASCAGDNEKTRAALLGRWELVKGFRNKKETGTLEGVFFQFGADGKMTTNLPVGSGVPTEYELRQNEILQKSPQEVVYRIQSMTESTLVLTAELKGMQFEFQLQKAAAPPPDPATQDTLSQSSDSLSE